MNAKIMPVLASWNEMLLKKDGLLPFIFIDVNHFVVMSIDSANLNKGGYKSLGSHFGSGCSAAKQPIRPPI